ncbi:hypothetical protein ACVK00_003396 [Burkholderia sp. PvR073]|uniref:hypothetical protein n=1 Tax=Burkholderia TaxID=32008 RepID=UPI002550A880|nr:hypothetical protein [Burkholderia sp. lyk4-R2A-23]
MRILALSLLWIATAAVGGTPTISDGGALRSIISCPLEDGSRITLMAKSHGVDGDSLFVQVRGKTEHAFLDMPDTDFVGRIVLSKCVDKTLVFALDYGSPYLKGVAIRQNPKTHVEERIYFAEKSLPRWLYVGRQEMLVIIPNEGYETDKKYLVYRYLAGKGQPTESTPTDRLPITKRNLIEVR